MLQLLLRLSRVHAASNELVHVFRRTDTGSIVGFQFWRTAPIGLPRGRVILGGKLRILPEFRNRGLHLGPRAGARR